MNREFPPRDQFGMTDEDWRWVRWEDEREMLSHRWRALKALWLKPVVDQRATQRRTDGVICYHADRDEEWTLAGAFLTTVAIIIDRRWGQRDVERYKARTGCSFVFGKSMCFWDSRATYGGYEVMICDLYPGVRYSIFSDGESLM